jgi:hypothetical protein
MIDPKRYSICIRLETEDGTDSYVGTVAELPDVLVCEDSYEEAYSAVLGVVSDLQDIAAESGRPFPVPVSKSLEAEYSGRVTLRLGKSLHRDISLMADADGVSLNSWICEAITARRTSVQVQQAMESFVMVSNVRWSIDKHHPSSRVIPDSRYSICNTGGIGERVQRWLSNAQNSLVPMDKLGGRKVFSRNESSSAIVFQ